MNDFICKAKQGEITIYNSSVINTTDNGWILIIHSEMLLIYGDNWTIEQFEEINDAFDLNKYTNFKLSGDDKLIDKLITFYKPKNFEIEKRRLLYQTAKTNVFENKNLKVRLGSFNEINDLASMLQEYYHEEYNGLKDKKIEEMKEHIISYIYKKKIYVLLNINDVLLSFCTIVDPDIGILFTKKEYRNKGYGKVILSYCSSYLQQKNDSVYLMTDRDKIESNIVCKKVGFSPYYKYKMIKINCG
ncbi:MAG: GNAT family N-acetyltransferase [Flavobacteriales bacterium]